MNRLINKYNIKQVYQEENLNLMDSTKYSDNSLITLFIIKDFNKNINILNKHRGNIYIYWENFDIKNAECNSLINDYYTETTHLSV